MNKGETVLSGAPHPGTEIEVMESPAGYYLGFRCGDGSPYSRETEYMSHDAAIVVFDVLRK